MALRGFGIQTLTGTAQPAYGTQLTAAITGLTKDRYTGNTDPRSQASTITCAVASIVFFRPGDIVIVGPAAGPWDSAKVTSVTVGASPAGTLGLKGLTASHLVTDFVILSIPVGGILLQPGPTNAQTFFIGEDSTVGVASLTLIGQITATQAAAGISFSPSYALGANTLDTPHIWVNGTAADKYLPSVLLF